MELYCCNICGKPHETGKCPALKNAEVIRDTVTISRARRTLPGGLEVLDLADGSTSVIARSQFKRGVQFGPVVAKKAFDLDPLNVFPMKIFSEDEMGNTEWEYLDTAEEDLCNWMCLVGAASCLEEQNLICFQMKKEVHFLSIKDVEPGDQLRVWYSPQYGIQMSAKRLESSLIDDNNFLIDLEEPVELYSDLRFSPQKYKKKIKLKLVDPLPVSLSKMRDLLACKLPPSVLGAKDPKREWICAICGTKSQFLKEYAEHLKTHFKGSAPHKCSSCRKDFKTHKAMINHNELCKNNMRSMTENVETSQISPPVNELDKTSFERNDARITGYEKKPLDHSDISNVLDSLTDNTTIKKLLFADSSRLLECSGKEPSLQKEYDILLDSLTDFRPNSLNIIGEANYSSKIPLKTDPNNVDSFEIRQRADIANNKLSVNAQSLRSKEIDSDNPPILGLGDEMVFQSIKSFTEIENVVDKNSNRGGKIPFASHQDHLQKIDGLPDKRTEIDQTLDPNDYLVLLYEKTMDVTDDDKDRLVDNLIKDSEDRSNINASDINCDAELIKVMLNDGAFSTPDLDGKNRINDDSATEIDLSPSNNTPFTSNFDKKIQEKRSSPEKCRETNNISARTNPICSSSNLTIIKQEHISAMTKGSDNVDSLVEVMPTKNKDTSEDIVFLNFGKLSENDNPTIRVDEYVSVTPNMKNKESSSDPGTNIEHNSLEELSLALDFNTSAAKIITDKNQENLDNNKSYSCDICNKKFSEPIYLYRHLKKHTGEFTCVQCLKVFARKETLENHTCSDVSVFLCKLCNLMFKTKRDLKKHNVQHKSEQNSNKNWSKLQVKVERDKNLPPNNTLSTEINNQSDSLGKLQLRYSSKVSSSCGGEVYLCETCGAAFKSKRGLQYHRQVHHSTGRQFTCAICNKKFHRKCVLKCHLDSHVTKNLLVKKVCPVCDKVLYGNKAFSSHIRLHTVHKKIKQYKCDICDKAYFQRFNLLKHIRTNHIGNDKLNNNWKGSSELVQIPAHKPFNSLENSEHAVLRSGDKQPGFSLQHKVKDSRKKLQNRNVEYTCRYCHTIMRSKASLMRHLKMKHPDCKEEWSIPEFVNSMSMAIEETAGVPLAVPHHQAYQFNAVENSINELHADATTSNPDVITSNSDLITSNSDAITSNTLAITSNSVLIPSNSDALTSSSDSDKNLSNSILNQLHYGFTLKTENDQESDAIVNHLLQLEGNGNTTPEFILGDDTAVQSEVKLNKDLFYLVLAPSNVPIL